MNEKLNKINFDKIIKIHNDNIDNYSIKEYFNNGNTHKVKGYCTLCEEEGCNVAIDDPTYKLTNISHGAHAMDFIESLESNIPDISDWNDNPVMFLFESPSLDYSIYMDLEYNNYIKRPAKQWYWVHRKLDYAKYPAYFKGAVYGELILSLVNTFKLKNAYITNLLKCGMNNEAGKFKGINSFSGKCINTCYENILKEEIEALKPTVIFTIGSNVHSNLSWMINNDKNFDIGEIRLINLPHPAGQRRGFKDEYYRALYFWVVAEGLYNSDILSKEDIQRLSLEYVNKDRISEEI